MPREGKVWRHIIISTRGAWLHGSAKGFRSRRHRIHSSGDYKALPPAGEHAPLLDYQRERSRPPVIVPRELRERIGNALCRSLTRSGHRVLAVAVGATHAHALVELPLNYSETRRIVGDAKCDSSRAVRTEIPGNVWAAGGSYKIIKDRPHQLRVFHYITKKQGPGACVLSTVASRAAAQRRPG